MKNYALYRFVNFRKFREPGSSGSFVAVPDQLLLSATSSVQNANRSRFSLPPRNRGYLPSLDGIRAICIVLVLGSHAPHGAGFPENWQYPSRFLFNGALGVLVFFVLSGFLITALLSREEGEAGSISLVAFYARRFIRVLPVYLAYVGVLVCLDFITGLDLPLANYATTLTFTKNFGFATWIDGHLWSLAVEEQFYLIWPLIFALASRRWRYFAAGLFIGVAPLFRTWSYVSGGGRNFWFMSNMDALMIGCVAAMLVSRYPSGMIRALHWRPTVFRAVALATIYGVWLSTATFAAGEFTVPFGPTVQSLGAAFLICSYAYCQSGLGFKVLNLPVMRYVGVLSYSIYIWQQPFFAAPSDFGVEKSWVLRFPINIVLALFIAGVSYHFLERPLLSLRKHFRPAAHPDAAENPNLVIQQDSPLQILVSSGANGTRSR